jgi:hypothetical protein
MQKKINFLKFFFLSAIIVSLFAYRDFLYNLKLMLFHFYNYKMLPLDPYYKIILKYSGLSNDHFRFPWEWRVIPNIINWLAFEILPCFKPKVIPDQINDVTYCSLWTISFVNFVAGIFAQVLLCYYAFIKLNRENYECIFLMFTSYFLIKFLDPFGVDRISFLFLIIFLFFSQSKISYFFIIFSLLVNDKCLLFITTYYFCNNIEYDNLKKILLNKKFLISLLISILYLCYIFKIIKGINSEEVSYNYFNFNSLTNTILPTLIAVFPFVANFQNQKILRDFNLDKNHIYFILIFLILGLVVGGPGNTGRYIVFGSLLFLPILNYQIFKIIGNLLFHIKK